MIKFEFPADRPDIAKVIGQALIRIGGQDAYDIVGDATVRDEHILAAGDGDDIPANDARRLFAGGSEHVAGETTVTPTSSGAIDGGEMAIDKEGTLVSGAEGEAAGITANPGAQVDMKGVAKDDKYCSTAQIPFYGSGKREGQWKRRQGVHENDYDVWYGMQLLLANGGPADGGGDEPADTAGAFGDKQADTAAENIPQTCGQYMGWISKKQADGLITQEDVLAAYDTAGIQLTDLFPPTADAVAAQNIAKLYDILSQKAGE